MGPFLTVQQILPGGMHRHCTHSPLLTEIMDGPMVRYDLGRLGMG